MNKPPLPPSNAPPAAVLNVERLGESPYGFFQVGLTVRQDKTTGLLIFGVALAGGKASEVAPFQPMQILVRDGILVVPVQTVVELFAAEEKRVAEAAALVTPLIVRGN